jgi:hypothetical protein
LPLGGFACSRQLGNSIIMTVRFSDLLPRIPQPRLALELAGIGALSFWLPDLAVHMIVGCRFDSPHVRVITLLMPGAFLLGYFVAEILASKREFTWTITAMLLGVWVTGGLFLAFSATTCGGGFAGPGGILGGLLMIVLSLFPPVTGMFALYDGSGLALLVVTIGPLLIWGILASGFPLPFRHRQR